MPDGVATEINLTKIEQRQAFKPERTAAKEPVIDLAKTAKERFQRDPQLHREIIANPYSAHAGIAVLSELNSTLSSEDAIRAVVLAEPEASYDRNFKALPPHEKQKQLYAQIENSAQATMRLADSLRTDDQRFLSMSDEQIYAELSQTAFGTTNLDQIDQNFAQNQRRGFRLGIVNFINDMHKMQPYREQFQTAPAGTTARAFGLNELSADVQVKISPLGFVITASEDDFASMLDLKPDELFGEKGRLTNTKIPDLQKKVLLLNRGGIKSGDVTSQADLADTEIHEMQHLVYDAFFREDSFTSGAALREALQADQSEQNLTTHQQQAELVKRWFMQSAKNELISYSAEQEFPVVTPDQLTTGVSMREILAFARQKLVDNQSLDPNQRQEIYLVYQQKYQDYLQQTREGQWIAHRLRDAVGQQRAEALMQITPLHQFKRLVQYFGVQPDDIQNLMQEDIQKDVKKFSESVTTLTDGNETDPLIWRDTIPLLGEFHTIRAYYPPEALPALLKIVQHSPIGFHTNFSLQAIEYALEGIGGKIPPELGITRTDITNTIIDMSQTRTSDQFIPANRTGNRVRKTIEQFDRLAAGNL